MNWQSKCLRAKCAARYVLLPAVVLALYIPTPGQAENEAPRRPNILVIMDDDMGYSDIGCYGGEIPTPNIDALAERGIRFSQFHNAAKCTTTRASLMTGLNSHKSGLSSWAKDTGLDGYRGSITHETVTIAEPLRAAGYRTYCVGKWHCGMPAPHWPLKRGFDRHYGIMWVALNYFDPTRGMEPGRGSVLLDGVEVGLEGQTRDPWYLTTQFTDYAVKFLDDASQHDQPFFMYLAYFAPHNPLQPLPADLERFDGEYLKGPDYYRQERYRRLIEKGLIDPQWKLPPSNIDPEAWDEMPEEERQRAAREMQKYAAMVWRVDQGVGKVVEKLKQMGVFDNTLILFLSDNGAAKVRDDWTTVSNTPFRGVKAELFEGGTATPLVVSWPAGIERSGRIVHASGHIMDLLPTCLDVAGAEYPDQWTREGTQYAIEPVDGQSLLPLIDGRLKDWSEDRIIFWEFNGKLSVRTPRWKLVSDQKRFDWIARSFSDAVSDLHLYNLQLDRTEVHDLATQPEHRAVTAQLFEQWKVWAKDIGVQPFSDVMKMGKNIE